MTTTVTLPEDPSPARASGSVWSLAVVALYDHPLDPPGLLVSLEDGVAVELGRGPTTAMVRRERDARLELADVRTSGRHARLTGNRVEDLRSRNGTLVNGARVEAAELRDGDFLEVGRTLLQLRRSDAEGAATMLELAAALRGSRQATLSPALLRELERVRRVAAGTLPVLVTGETGAGKEELARALHAWSGRAGELVAVNCAAIPTHLAESELFGHRRGAFTGADRDRTGLLAAAHGGTLLLDEVDSLPREVQPMLLRFLQDKLVRRVGETSERELDVRIVAASNADLGAAVEAGRFRADLQARLCGLLVHLPPLRERKEDLGLLVAHLLRRHLAMGAPAPRLSPEAWRVLVRRSWPRNVRELERCLEAALLLSRDGQIEESHVAPQAPPPAAAPAPSHLEPPANASSAVATAAPQAPAPRAAPPRSARRPAAQAERELRLALAQGAGNVSAVARVMGVSRMQVYRWMRQFGLATDGSKTSKT